jgi:hypothetical protein
LAVFLYFFHILIVSYLLVQIQVEDDGAEDVTSVAAHIKALQDEMRKTIPNMTLLDDRMQRTMTARRESIKTVSLSELLVLYPALKLDYQVSSYYVDVFTLNIDCSLSMLPRADEKSAAMKWRETIVDL